MTNLDPVLNQHISHTSGTLQCETEVFIIANVLEHTANIFGFALVNCFLCAIQVAYPPDFLVDGSVDGLLQCWILKVVFDTDLALNDLFIVVNIATLHSMLAGIV
jgi:hypothetical protein